MIAIRRATSDADLEAWIEVRRRVHPDEPAGSVERLRALEAPRRLLLLAEDAGELAGSGLADRSDTGQGFVAPRVLPGRRRRGVGTALLERLLEHVRAQGFDRARALVDDEGSLAFAQRHGFEEVDRQVEQVRALGDEPAVPPFDGVVFTTVAERPELLEASFPLAEQGYADLVLATGTVSVPLEDWLRDEATLPGGSVVALADRTIVGYAGLLAWDGDPTRAENGLTVVDRGWRGRGLAAAMKRRQLAWASQAGIREVVTWTQVGNEAMRRVNERLGYVTRTVSRTVARGLEPDRDVV
jgi:GNAT superfamily N-acetyltransferase